MNIEEFNAAKRAALEKCTGPMLSPDRHSLPKMTVNDIAVLFAPDADHVLNSAAVYRMEKAALESLRRTMSDFGISSFGDCLSDTGGRLPAKQCNAAA